MKNLVPILIVSLFAFTVQARTGICDLVNSKNEHAEFTFVRYEQTGAKVTSVFRASVSDATAMMYLTLGDLSADENPDDNIYSAKLPEHFRIELKAGNSTKEIIGLLNDLPYGYIYGLLRNGGALVRCKQNTGLNEPE